MNDFREQAIILHRNGSLSKAESIYRNILAIEPNPTDAANLGSLLRSAGRLRESEEHYENWIKKYPMDLILRLNAINNGIERNSVSLCKQWVDEGKIYHRDKWKFRRAEARVMIISEEYREAVKILEELNKKNPDDIDNLLDLSTVCIKLKQYNRAEEKLLENGERLNNPKVVCNLLSIYMSTNRGKEFAKLLDDIPDKLKNESAILSIRGQNMIGLRRYEEAKDIFYKLCMIEPEVPIYWLNLSACYRGLRRPVDALRCAKYGSILSPEDSLIQQSLFQGMVEQGKQEKAKPILEKVIRDYEKNGIKNLNIFNIQFSGNGYQLIESSKLKSLAQTWEQMTTLGGLKNIWADHILEAVGKRKLRIGYFSADFSGHPIGRFMIPILKNHNKGKVKIIGFDCNSVQDKINSEIRSMCDEWHIITSNDSLKCARLISDRQIDILVDLGGYTAKSRLDILVYRPCRIQLSYLGYFAPTYLKCIDGWIGDEYLFSKLNETDKKENLLVVDGGYMAFDKNNTGEIQQISKERKIRIGCFNHTRKLNWKTMKLFSKVVKSIENCELVLKSISFVDKKEKSRIEQTLKKIGLNESQFKILECSKDHKKHLEAYNLVDFMLDPIPYGGATTTCEALAMGVPVIAYSGMGMVGQLSCSILHYSGCDEWICKTEKEYIDACKKLAGIGTRNKKKRTQLRSKVNNSALCDSKRLAAQLEKIYYEMTTKEWLSV